MTDVGRVPTAPGASAVGAGAEQVVSAHTGDAPSREEFTSRFKARMLAVAGLTFADGDSVADYADEAAPTYFETDWQRAEGPEACADADISYWEGE